MAKGGKKGGGAKGKKVTLKMAKNAVRLTTDGRRRLDLSNMGIATFPKCDLASLCWLDLHSNQLEAIPETLSQLVALSHLNLSNNRLTSTGLPSSLGNLARLRSLNLGMNRLDTLPPTMVGLCSLQELGLFDNLFSSLPEFIKVLPSIIRLNTKRNPLSYAQGDSGATRGEGGLEEGVYLAKEGSLCGSCLESCKEERRWMLGGRRDREGDAEGRGGSYSGLITPNSVAQANQEQWR
ncbi:unnamed protein product, partial [Coregonus sp. 'balchen']